MLRLTALSGLLFLVSACAAVRPWTTSPVATEFNLLASDRALADAARTQGARAAFTTALDPQAGVVIRDGKPAAGVAAVAALFAPGAAEQTWTPGEAHVSPRGEMGVTRGAFVRSAGGVEVARGHYTTVWRRGADGLWRVLVHTTSEEPPPAPVGRVVADPAAAETGLLGAPVPGPAPLTLPRLTPPVPPRWVGEQPPKGGIVKKR